MDGTFRGIYYYKQRISNKQIIPDKIPHARSNAYFIYIETSSDILAI
jgi:hypothetical protein